MRYVPYDAEKINYPDGWHESAAEAQAAVAGAPEEERSDEVNRHRKLWADLRPELAKVMHGKCWYTEALQVGTDTDVDHFRPKNHVKGVQNPNTKAEHPGYWWYAFDPANYRYSCIVANRLRRDITTGLVGGKSDEFPLWNEAERAWTPEDNCGDEQPLLIDPCKASEVALISFAENGEATPRHSRETKPKFYEKAYRSIVLYHLNHSDFVKERIKIRESISRLVEDAKRYYRRLGTDAADADDEHAYMRVIEELRKARSEEAPFSSFADAMLRPFRMDESLEGVFIGG